MIYLLCGMFIFAIGLVFLISPAQQPNRLYGYLSYLAQINHESFKYAQKIARNTALISGAIQMFLGIIIYLLRADNYFFLWLITAPLFIIPFFAVTETKLRLFLKKRNELPPSYQLPDERPRKQRTKGFKER